MSGNGYMMRNHNIRILLFYPLFDTDAYPTYCFLQHGPCWPQYFGGRQLATWYLTCLGLGLKILRSRLTLFPDDRCRPGQCYDYLRPRCHLCYLHVNDPSFSGYTTA